MIKYVLWLLYFKGRFKGSVIRNTHCFEEDLTLVPSNHTERLTIACNCSSKHLVSSSRAPVLTGTHLSHTEHLKFKYFRCMSDLRVVVHTCDLSPQEAEAGGWKVQSQFEPHTNEFHANLSYPNKAVSNTSKFWTQRQSKGRICKIRLDTLE